MASLAAANAEFGFNLLREMDNSQGNENVFLSFLSIFTALSLVRLGARGDCANQIDKTLYFNTTSGHRNSSNNQPTLQFQLKKVLSDINASHKDYELSVANGLFVEKEFDINKKYIECAEKLYEAKVDRVDFTNDIEDTTYRINKWIKNVTHGKIKKVFSDSSISSSAVMVLVNAVYFKGKWKSAFTQSETIKCRFKSPKCSKQAVPMMHQERRFNLTTIQDPSMQVLQLRYHGGISMYVLLPERDLSQIEKSLTFRNLMKWTNPRKMNSQFVEVFLPKFKIEKNYEMKHHLEALGLKDIFDESRADLSGIASGGRLYISKLMHKSYIEVTEEGTQATAATESNIVEKHLPESTVFKADHPFLFVIRKNDIILFSGKVSCP
ncbi:serpin B7 [Heterocephalus glaber]|uniref:Serpin B7 n=1 Tax=Heterocephalus glaber TaxID=10181 RepID=A0AAX6RC62_HETGA|nr:serpin B7 [Heterocephalus glaber]XP_021094946.1 serpin B7 [Heterocephalus glaber]XP_021094947.1 serpin B7 [Heterocephalus glaber]